MIVFEGDGTSKGIKGRLEINTLEGARSIIEHLEEEIRNGGFNDE